MSLFQFPARIIIFAMHIYNFVGVGRISLKGEVVEVLLDVDLVEGIFGNGYDSNWGEII